MLLMVDEHGNKIDLDLIDAIGQFPDGSFDVWMCDGTRVVTREAGAADVWRDYIRSQVEQNKARKLSHQRVSPEFSWRTGMNKAEKKKIARSIVDQLLSQNAESTTYFVTNNREEYDLLLDAAFKGVIEDVIYLSRSGIWINRKRIVPPESYFVRVKASESRAGHNAVPV
jgi:hypothetical protein